MNIDDMHDPDPRRPDVDASAKVAGGTRRIRRRRAALVGAGVALALAIVVVSVLALTGDEEGGRLVPATVPDVPATSTTFPPTTTGTTATTSTVPAAPEVVAIEADGDAVRIGADGSPTVLFDGADPRVQPEEGELTIVDSVAVTPDGRTFVSTCCEPVPGSWYEVAEGAEPAFRAYGHALDVGSDGQTLLTVGSQAITISDLDGQEVASAILEGSINRLPYEATWLPDDRIAVLEYRQVDDRNELVLYVIGSLSDAAAASGVVLATDIDAPWPQLAGVGEDGSVLVLQGTGDPATATSLQAYEPDTLERGDDVSLPATATHARMQDGVLTWIGADGTLHVGDAVVPGEYRWARPVR